MSIEVYPTLNNVKLTANFMLNEFRSKDGSELVVIDRNLINILQKIRDEVKRPVTINSGHRTPAHNRAVGGAANSQHMYGRAADIVVQGYTPAQVATMAKKYGAAYTQVYPTFCHVDTRILWSLDKTAKIS